MKLYLKAQGWQERRVSLVSGVLTKAQLKALQIYPLIHTYIHTQTKTETTELIDRQTVIWTVRRAVRLTHRDSYICRQPDGQNNRTKTLKRRSHTCQTRLRKSKTKTSTVYRSELCNPQQHWTSANEQSFFDWTQEGYRAWNILQINKCLQQSKTKYSRLTSRVSGICALMFFQITSKVTWWSC